MNRGSRDFFVTDNVSNLVDDDDNDEHFCLKTRSMIPFGWPVKRGRRIALFLLFLPGGALSALLLIEYYRRTARVLLK